MPARQLQTGKIVTLMLVMFATPATAQNAKPSDLATALVFYASFDSGCDLNLSSGSGMIYTAETLARDSVQMGNHRPDAKIVKGGGRFGDALHFAAKSKQVLFYRGDELHFPEQDWQATVSFWLKLNPDEDLEPGFCDPLQITEKAWNNASWFVDFDKDLPRDFRLGVFSDYDRWNPDNIPWAKFPEAKRPLVVVKKPPFSRSDWTHVAFTIAKANPSDDSPGEASFYLNGQPQGTLQQRMYFDWNLDKVAIMLGINYIGYFDDLAIFQRSFNAEEVRKLYELPDGIRSLY